MKESEIQSAICEYLAARNHFFFRCNNTPIYDTKRGIFRAQPKYTPKGVADIILVKEGQAVFLEVKRPKGRPSDDQMLFAAAVQKAGGAYFIVYSIDDVQALGL